MRRNKQPTTSRAVGRHRRRSTWRLAPGGEYLQEFSTTKRRPWTVRAENRRRNKVARASRKANQR